MGRDFFNLLNIGDQPLTVIEELQTHYYTIGKEVLAINYNENLEEILGKSLRHVEIPPQPVTDFRIDCLVINPDFGFPFQKEDYGAQGLLDRYNDEYHFSTFHHGVNSYSFYNRKSKHGYYLVRNSADIPVWEASSPFRNIFHWWSGDTEYQLIHGAYLSIYGIGIILSGKGGSGKSSTTIGGILNGHKTLGEDYLLINPYLNEVYSLYCTAKLDHNAINRFPELEVFIDARNTNEEKTLLYIEEIRKGAIKIFGKVNFHLLPQVNNGTHTSINTTSSSNSFRSLSPSTIFQLPRLEELSFKKCSKFCRTIPAYEISLGTDPEEINNVLDEFIKNQLQAQ